MFLMHQPCKYKNQFIFMCAVCTRSFLNYSPTIANQPKKLSTHCNCVKSIEIQTSQKHIHPVIQISQHRIWPRIHTHTHTNISTTSTTRTPTYLSPRVVNPRISTVEQPAPIVRAVAIITQPDLDKIAIQMHHHRGHINHHLDKIHSHSITIIIIISTRVVHHQVQVARMMADMEAMQIIGIETEIATVTITVIIIIIMTQTKMHRGEYT